MQTLITADFLLAADRIVPEPMLLIEDGTVRSIASRGTQEQPATAQHHHHPGATLAAALFDIHTHGACGHDVMEATAEALTVVGRFLGRHGVGAYLPTTISAPEDATLRSLEGLRRLLEAPPVPGVARPLGIHLEGPFLSHIRRGTHRTADLQPPSITFFDRMYEAAGGLVHLLTIAPELPGALDLVAHALRRGVRVSVGHSDATAGETQAAIALGASSATHTFNAMRPLAQRDPGILGTVLTDDQLYAEFICDGIHTEPSIAKLFARCKGPERAILVTDAMSATGMSDGSYKLGSLDVLVRGGRAVTGENTLAGSTLTLDRAVRNYADFAAVPVATALYAATRNPARMLALEATTGTLTEGGRADLAAVSATGHFEAVYLGGQRVGAPA